MCRENVHVWCFFESIVNFMCAPKRNFRSIRYQVFIKMVKFHIIDCKRFFLQTHLLGTVSSSTEYRSQNYSYRKFVPRNTKFRYFFKFLIENFGIEYHRRFIVSVPSLILLASYSRSKINKLLEATEGLIPAILASLPHYLLFIRASQGRVTRK